MDDIEEEKVSENSFVLKHDKNRKVMKARKDRNSFLNSSEYTQVAGMKIDGEGKEQTLPIIGTLRHKRGRELKISHGDRNLSIDMFDSNQDCCNDNHRIRDIDECSTSENENNIASENENMIW